MTSGRLVVFPDADPDLVDQLGDAEELLGEVGELQVFVGRPSSAEDYRRRIAGASALLLGWDLPSEVLEATPSLEVISFLGSGPSNFVDLEACARAGITVTSVPGYGDTAVAEHTLALILASIRGVVAYDRGVRDGAWGITGMSHELEATTLGILGLGGIGTQVARLGTALGMRVIAWTRSGRPGEVRDGTSLAALDSVLSESDVVSLHLPLLPATAGILSAPRLARMKPGAFLVNTARAELVDEAALIEALEHGRLGGAAFDVLWAEPPPGDHRLLQLANVVLTPHVAFATSEASQRLVGTAIENVLAYFRGEPMHVVIQPTGAAE